MKRETKFVVGLVAANIIIRLIYFFSNTMFKGGGDWYSYTELAIRIQKLNFFNYDFTRTPGFPLTIILSNADFQSLNWSTVNFQNTVILQMIMGVMIAVLLFYIIKQLSSYKFAVAGSLLYTIFIPHVFYEFFIISETTALFYFTLTAFLLLLYLKKKQGYILLLLGLSTSLMVLTKPETIIFAVIIGLQLLYGFRNEIVKNYKNILYYTLPNLIIIGGWMILFYQQTGTVGVSTLAGNAEFSKAEFCCFDEIPKHFSDPNSQKLMDIYLEQREVIFKETPDLVYWTIWNMDMQKKMELSTGLNYAQRSKIFGSIAISAFKKAKYQYIKNSLSGFIKQYRILGVESSFLPVTIFRFIVNWVLRIGFYLCEIGFIISIFYFRFSRQKIQQYFNFPEFYIIFCIALLLTQISSAMIGHGNEGNRAFFYCKDIIFILGGIFLYRYSISRINKSTLKILK